MADVPSDSFPRPPAPPPVFYLAGLAIGYGLEWLLAPPTIPVLIRATIGPLLTAAAIGLAVWAIDRFRRHRTSIDVYKPAAALVTDGPFKISRNPMYVGLALLYAGLGIGLDLGWSLLLLPIVLIGMRYIVIGPEEAYLERLFGAVYLAYKGRVRRWL